MTQAAIQQDVPVIEALTAELVEVRNQLRLLSAEEKELKRKQEELQYRMMQAMDAVGTSVARANGHSISISTSTVATITDYSEFADWLVQELPSNPEYLAIFQRRISDPMFRELLDERGGEDIPGLAPFEKRTLSLRILS